MYKMLAMAAFTLGASPALAQNAAPPLTRSAVEAQLKATFGRTDTNHDGSISPAESEAARNASIAAQFSTAFTAMDANKDSTLSREEFVSANQKALTAAMAKQGASAKAFAAGDLNHDGKIVVAEAMAGPLRQFDEIDANHDGTLTVAERQAAAKKAPAGK